MSRLEGSGVIPSENFAFPESQISYFQHFEEYSKKKLINLAYKHAVAQLLQFYDLPNVIQSQ
jgi:hypothetical protein